MKKPLYFLVFLTVLVAPLIHATAGLANPEGPDAPSKIFLPLVFKNYSPEGTLPGGSLAAFPGAMVFGTDTAGGRGGRVIYVTNLNDSGPGSFREALSASGPRIVLFRVSGTIDLASEIHIKNPYVTIAGQTAPGGGVQIRGGQIVVLTHDVIIRYLKVRSGDGGGQNNDQERDPITVNGNTDVYNIVIDHSTMIWGPDIGGIALLNAARDSTVSNSIIGEGLYLSEHPEAVPGQGGHSTSLNISELNSTSFPTRITVYHNLLTTSSDRNPRVIGGANIDIVNNVIYNWRNSPSQGNPRSLNLIKNYFIPGPMTTNRNALAAWLPKAESGSSLRQGSVFESGNLAEGFTSLRDDPQSVYSAARFEPYSIANEVTPQEAYAKILDEVGASRQVSGSDGTITSYRDPVDERIIGNLINRTGTFVNGIGYDGGEGFPAISWPVLASGTPAVDNDNDGMPDAWEGRYFGNTNRGSPNDSSGDLDGDGYTDLEEYINSTDPTQG
jgi:pectate lyase